MCDTIDEYIIQNLTTYKDVKMINIAKDDLSIPVNENEENVDLTKFEKLCEKIKTVLADKVDTVKVSTKIESQPAIIVNPMGISANMERILRAQTLSNKNSELLGSATKS
jgi:HSP90 family molecular chaperone